MDIYRDFCFGKLAVATSDSDTALVLEDVSLFPSDYELSLGDMWLVIESPLAIPHSFEIVKLLTVDAGTNTLTVQRASSMMQPSFAHAAGTFVKAPVAARMLTNLRTAARRFVDDYQGDFVLGDGYTRGALVTYNSGLWLLSADDYSGLAPGVPSGTTSSPRGGVTGSPASGQSGAFLQRFTTIDEITVDTVQLHRLTSDGITGTFSLTVGIATQPDPAVAPEYVAGGTAVATSTDNDAGNPYPFVGLPAALVLAAGTDYCLVVSSAADLQVTDTLHADYYGIDVEDALHVNGDTFDTPVDGVRIVMSLVENVPTPSVWRQIVAGV